MDTDSISIDRRIVAVDGPAAAGKTTTSRALSTHYDLRYLESGTAYRFITYLALRDGVDLGDGPALVRLCSAALFEDGIDILDDIVRRDAADRDRAVSPLRPADDAMVIDTSELTVAEVLSLMMRRCEEVGLTAVGVPAR
jgi:cytidylate kinase